MQPEMTMAVPVFMARNLTAMPREIKGAAEGGGNPRHWRGVNGRRLC